MIHIIFINFHPRVVKLAESDQEGQGTFGMVNSQNLTKRFEELQIRRASEEIEYVSKFFNGTVDLLHANCEGCEWEMLEDIISSGQHTNIRTIQFGSHYFRQVEDIVARFCRIRAALSRTHVMVYGQAWGYERWDRK